MLEVLKQYGEEKFLESPQVKAHVESQHSAFFSSFLHQREDALKGGDQKTAIDEIGAEVENIRAAVQWAINNHHYATLSQAIEGFYRYFEKFKVLQRGQTF